MRKTAIISVAAVLLLLVFALPSYSSPPEAKRILSLVDYIGGDYRNAVSGGEIINGDEYREMLEFSSEVGGLFSDMEKEGGDSAGHGRYASSSLSSSASHVCQDRSCPAA